MAITVIDYYVTLKKLSSESKTGKKNTQKQKCNEMLLESKDHNKGLISQLLPSKYLEAQFSLFLIKLHS